MRDVMPSSRERALLARRTVVLARFAKFAPLSILKSTTELSSRDVEALERKIGPAADAADLGAAFADAQRAWAAYRDAEVALFEHVSRDSARSV